MCFAAVLKIIRKYLEIDVLAALRAPIFLKAHNTQNKVLKNMMPPAGIERRFPPMIVLEKGYCTKDLARQLYIC
jgi:hypothetical protein